jgi:phosphatidylserine/phosphatidylglycerophosphate/cardiolipin synthase-like enzyme
MHRCNCRRCEKVVDAGHSWEKGQQGTTAEADARVEKAVDLFFAENWTFGDPRPELYYDPRTVAPFSKVSLHAKCVVVDRRQTLVTSANFTDRGQTRNIEVGVLIEDVAFATRLHEQWWGLVSAGLVRRPGA